MRRERHPASAQIDLLPTADVVRIIQEADATVAPVVAAAAGAIARAVDGIAERLERGGRWFYVGAGTSGRLAMLDASELRPTYGVDPSLITVIMAGGERAFLHAAEGAEDDADAGARAVRVQATSRDVVVGVAASGTTPFTVAAVRAANEIGALTVGVACRPGSPLATEAQVPVVADVGPEVIMGSTRMKSGTAQKMILNALSTAVMIRLGRVYGDLMVDMPPTNEKLRKRAVRMVELAANVRPDVASRSLDAAGANVKVAAVIAKKGLSADAARDALARHSGRLRPVLDE